MLRGYSTAREHVTEVVALVDTMFAWRRAQSSADSEGELRGIAELEFEVARQEDVIDARLAATTPPLPLQVAGDRFALSATERRALALLVALEVSTAEGRPPPTLGLLDTLIYRSREQREHAVHELARDGALFADALVELATSRDVPWLSTPVRVAPRVVELALGRLRLDLEVARYARLVDEPRASTQLVLETEARTMIDDAVRRADGTQPVPVLVGPPGSGRTTLVHGAARARGVPVLEVHGAALPRDVAELDRALRALRREAMLFRALLFVRDLDTLAPAAGQPDLIPRVADGFARYPGPVAASAAHECWPSGSARVGISIDVPVPGEIIRAELFARALDDFELAEQAAARYRLTGGLIERASSSAKARASARGTAIQLDDLRVAIRGLLDSELSALGRRVEWRQTWDDLVLPQDILDELRELVSRVRNRKRVLDQWGFGRKVGKGTGLSALFSGPPGTGKTMVAGLLATELKLDLYQIDTSRLVSKWVGETEKNLAKLFDAAAAGHAILLFDEADSLFAKRTEVKSSNDRYANLEVNYLLQRMEQFDGISILTTNLESAIDEAFQRRLAFRIAFQLPELEERERLWRAMLPTNAAIGGPLDFRALAERFVMSGGYIRNAALRAAYLAAADNSPITQRHLQRAATLEYTAMGKIIQHGGSSL
ncbi:MAG: AAA family ATPase [Myxococcales bacterium]|nr:AAA family ATPase [Myxococcales bacterium]